MNYRIEYAPMRLPKSPAPPPHRQLLLLTGGAFCFFLFLTAAFWPEGRQALLSLLLPGPEAGRLLSKLAEGVPAGEAVESFCRELLAGAGLS